MDTGKIKIKEMDLEFSRIGLGCAQAGLKWDGADADRLFDGFWDMGGNVYDTARVYSDWVGSERGRSERILGEWLAKSGKRQNVILVTKGGHPELMTEHVDMHQPRVDTQQMRLDLEASLRALQTDYIDLYFYHRDDESIPVSVLIEQMETFRQEGKIRYYGCSNWSAKRIKEADAYASEKGYRGFAANEVLFNLGEPHMKPTADDTLVSMDEEMYRYHTETEKNLCIPYSSVCNGFFHKFLTGREKEVIHSEYYTNENLEIAKKLPKIMEAYGCSITQAVLGFHTVQEFTCLPLYTPRNLKDLQEAMDAFRIPFRAEDFR